MKNLEMELMDSSPKEKMVRLFDDRSMKIKIKIN